MDVGLTYHNGACGTLRRYLEEGREKDWAAGRKDLAIEAILDHEYVHQIFEVIDQGRSKLCDNNSIE